MLHWCDDIQFILTFFNRWNWSTVWLRGKSIERQLPLLSIRVDLIFYYKTLLVLLKMFRRPLFRYLKFFYAMLCSGCTVIKLSRAVLAALHIPGSALRREMTRLHTYTYVYVQFISFSYHNLYKTQIYGYLLVKIKTSKSTARNAHIYFGMSSRVLPSGPLSPMVEKWKCLQLSLCMYNVIYTENGCLTPQHRWLPHLQHYHLVKSLGLFAWFWSDADKKFQTRSREQIGAVKKRNGFGCVWVVLSQWLACRRTKKLCSLFCNNGVSREVIIK